ncbi:MAG: hypothetical protein GWP08_08180 [Nitrospiraceae bacterium]|nr:hypothetical protein [Nitrospiraceae bacterium]
MALRRLNQDSSLELLLDTICNVFGGIVLMAILIVLQMQGTLARMPTPTQQDMARSLEARKLAFEKARLAQEVADLDRQRAAFAVTSGQPDSNALSELVGRYGEFKVAIKTAGTRLSRQKTDVEKEQRTLGEAQLKKSRTDLRLRAKRQEAQVLKQQLLDLAKRPRQNIRLPHRRGAARGTARYYLIKDDKLFRAGVGGIRWIGPAYTLEDCLITPGADGTSATIKPLKTMGIGMPDAGKPLDAVLATLRGYPPRGYYCVFCVYRSDKSYQSFQRMRKAVSDLGYSYNVQAFSVADGALSVFRASYHETE